jgi:molecular chaperone HscB
MLWAMLPPILRIDWRKDLVVTDQILSCNFFELLKIPVSYDVDLDTVQHEYRELQKKVHPDNYASSDDRDKRLSMQITSHVNEALHTLKDDVLRAAYMLSLKGIDINLDNETTRDMAFLMEQLELRERLESIRDEADPLESLDSMSEKVKQSVEKIKKQFVQSYDDDQLDDAREALRKLQFTNKLKLEINKSLEQIEDEMMG